MVIDFMAYARKVPTKKMNLVTCEDFFNALWRTFSALSKGCSRIDKFLTCTLTCTKEGERSRGSKLDLIQTNIATVKQQLPVEIDRFWASSANKMKFQQAFIKWMSFECKVDVPWFLGGAHAENVTACMKICSDDELIEEVDALRNDHEEADDRMLFHLNQAITDERFERAVIASGDTDVFICVMYHYNRWVYCDLNEMSIVNGKSGSTTAFAIHLLAEKLDPSVVDILPSVHALTGSPISLTIL